MPLLISRAPKRRRKARSDILAVGGTEFCIVLVVLAGEGGGEAEAPRGAAVRARAPEEGAAGREGAEPGGNFKALHRCRPEAVQI